MEPLLTVADVMVRDVVTVDPDDDVQSVARTLHESAVGSVLVTRDGRLEGILTESDVVGLVVEAGDLGAIRVGDVASSPVETVSPDTDLLTAATRLRERGVKKLPVVEPTENGDETASDGADDRGRVVGIVTVVELSYYLPHLAKSHVTDEPASGESRRQTRIDTAYEREDWTFESIGHDDTVVKVGDEVRFSKVLSADDVDSFAAASGDTNRLHLDEAYAEGTRFGRRVAHGTLVCGVVSAALARLPGLVIYLSQSISYVGPVDVGERVTAHCEVVEAIDDGRYRLETTATDEDGEVVVDGEAVVLVDDVPDTA